MGVFSRLSDIINSNINSILDKAEDPEKLVKMIIGEMEQTLIEVRSASARSIAEKKELTRKIDYLQAEVKLWQDKAELAVSKGRDDLAKSALKERDRVQSQVAIMNKEIQHLEDALQKLDFDISRLQAKLNEAVARRDAMYLRHQTLQKQKQVRQQIHTPNLDIAFDKFSVFERRIDQMEAEIEAMELGRNVSLKDQIDDLVISEKLEKELAEIKKKFAKAS